MCSVAGLLDYLIGDGEQARRKGETECFRGLQIDDELKLSRLHDWHVGRFFTIEDTASVDARLVVCIRDISSVAHQTTSHRALAALVDRRDRMTRNERYDVLALTVEEGIGADDERVSPLLASKSRKLSINFPFR